MSSLIRVLVVDDHHIVRHGLTSLLIARNGMQVVGEAATGEESIVKALRLKPDVILMDLMMPGMGGAEAMRIIRADWPAARHLVLTNFADDDHISAALQAGARGFLRKDTSLDELLEAIRNVAKGAIYLPQEAVQNLVHGLQRTESSTQDNNELTVRELDVLAGVAKGLSNQEIAELLYISHSTVRSHMTSLLDKLGFTNRTQAAVYARESGILTTRALSG